MIKVYANVYLKPLKGYSRLPWSDREKCLENEIFFQVREKSGNLKINGYSRQTSENLYLLFKKGKDVLSHEIV